MKKIGEWMSEAGFNPNGSEATKEAFIKYLIKASTGQMLTTPMESKEISENQNKVFVMNQKNKNTDKLFNLNKVKLPEQLSFEFDQEDEKKSPIKKASNFEP